MDISIKALPRITKPRADSFGACFILEFGALWNVNRNLTALWSISSVRGSQVKESYPS